ncbi:unnamed protein product [Parajaminaea phylloscopi]
MANTSVQHEAKTVAMPSTSTPQPLTSALPDSLHVAQLSVRMNCGLDAWGRLNAQPVTLDIQVHTDVSKAGRSDHLPYSIHYGILVKEVEKHCQEHSYRTLEELADGVAKVCLFVCKAPKVTLRVHKPRSLLHAKWAGVEVVRTPLDFCYSDGRVAQIAETVPDLSTLALSPVSVSARDDKLIVRDLLISTILGVNPWERVDKQVLKINLTVFTGLQQRQRRNADDEVTSPQDYRTIVRAISEYVESTDYKTVESLALSIAEVAVMQNRVQRIRVRVDKPSAIMYAESAGCEIERDRSFFEDEASTSPASQPTAPSTSGAAAVKSLSVPSGKDIASSSSPSASQPQALQGSVAALTGPSEWHVVAIALGSNLGDRVGNIERAVTALENHPACRLIDTSFLYETAPMYYTDQPKFLNAACRIATTLSPEDLLNVTQSIETEVGRDKRGVPIKGPRVIDLDIIFYDVLEMQTPRLTIPHEALLEREFVLRPLADILPDYAHPKVRRTVHQLLKILMNSPEYEPQQVFRVTPIGNADAPWSWGTKTFVMGIINTTPDSFSDAGDNLNVANAVKTAEEMVAQGADILDVGGMSTAPNAPEVTEDDEIARTAPVIRAIRSNPRTSSVPISIDTFRSAVARAALEAGANVINDVTGGERDPEILTLSREQAAPIVLMHTRGDSKTMNSLATYDGDVVEAVSKELEQRFAAALRRGVRRWNVILDPGIGFAKNQEGNLALLRGLASITSANAGAAAVGSAVRSGTGTPQLQPRLKRSLGQIGEPTSIAERMDHAPNTSLASIPLLVGASRKRFIGAVTGRTEPKDRVFGTAAACTAAVAQGCDVIRVHDVPEMVDAARMADAVFRR